MDYGLALPIGGECGDPRFLVELGIAAEGAGWDGVFLEDYIWYQGDAAIPTCDPWAALTAMALRTARVRLGFEVVALARRRPWVVARQGAAVDQLSGGRFVFGVAQGDTGDPGFTSVHEPLGARVRAELLDEGLAIVAGLWAGEPFSFDGKHYTVDEVTFRPPPVQRPRPPIWIGGGYPNRGPTERALRWDGACMYRRGADGADGGHLRAEDVRDLRARAGRRPWTIAVGGQPRRDDWDEEREQIRAVSAAGANWWVEWVPPGSADEMRAAVARGPLRAA
jgi:alkanesulfonate monooxygenase SsuD/methylene tetrahydromethanopterin reductase-like flavin-dependent oxidoreductase (luciferase family)